VTRFCVSHESEGPRGLKPAAQDVSQTGMPIQNAMLCLKLPYYGVSKVA